MRLMARMALAPFHFVGFLFYSPASSSWFQFPYGFGFGAIASYFCLFNTIDVAFYSYCWVAVGFGVLVFHISESAFCLLSAFLGFDVSSVFSPSCIPQSHLVQVLSFWYATFSQAFYSFDCLEPVCCWLSIHIRGYGSLIFLLRMLALVFLLWARDCSSLGLEKCVGSRF